MIGIGIMIGTICLIRNTLIKEDGVITKEQSVVIPWQVANTLHQHTTRLRRQVVSLFLTLICRLPIMRRQQKM